MEGIVYAASATESGVMGEQRSSHPDAAAAAVVQARPVPPPSIAVLEAGGPVADAHRASSSGGGGGGPRGAGSAHRSSGRQSSRRTSRSLPPPTSAPQFDASARHPQHHMLNGHAAGGPGHTMSYAHARRAATEMFLLSRGFRASVSVWRAAFLPGRAV